jgi:dihydrodipicolinate synthase/N-acetylneuraminate lyase
MESDGLPKGLVIDLVTPIDSGGDIDGKGLNSLLKRVLPYADAILLASPRTGEGLDLGPELKKDLFKKAINYIRGKAPIFFWISEYSAEDTKGTLTLLEETSKDFAYKGPVFWVDSPLFYHSNRGLYDHYTRFTENSGNPVVLYNDPGLIGLLDMPLKRSNIRTDILKNLCNIEKIAGLIFYGPLNRANNYQKALSRRPDFRVYDGDETRFLKYPSLSGVVSAGASIAPGLWSTVTGFSTGILRDHEDKYTYLKEIWETGNTLKRLIQIYSKHTVPVIKKTLVDLKVIGSSVCITENGNFDDPAAKLIEILAAVK